MDYFPSRHTHLPIADNSDNDYVDPFQMLVDEISDGSGERVISVLWVTLLSAQQIPNGVSQLMRSRNSRWSKRRAARSPVTDRFKKGKLSKILLGSIF